MQMTTAEGSLRGPSEGLKYIYFSPDGGPDLAVGTAPSKEMGARPTHPRLLLPTLVSRESSPTLFGWTVQLAVVDNHAVIKQLLPMTLEGAFPLLTTLSDAPGDKQLGATLSLPPSMVSHRLLSGFNWSLERVWICDS